MRSFILAATICATALASGTVQASGSLGGNWYAGLEGGLNIAKKSELLGDPNGLHGNADYNDGYVFGGFLGYDLAGPLRLEAEIARRHNNIDGYSFTNDGIPGSGIATTMAGAGSTKVTSGMVNMLLDIGQNWSITPYAGLGLGIARVNFDGLQAAGGTVTEGSDTVFAYQAIAGLSKAINKAMDVTLDYRYFATDKSHLNDALGRAMTGDYAAHAVMLGLRWKFGGQEEQASAPAPVQTAKVVQPVQETTPAPTPTPAPEPEQVAGIEPATGPYVVYFDWDKANISPAAIQVIQEAAEAAKAGNPAKILLKAYADRSGPDYYNVELSKRRAAAVRQALVAEGVDPDEISSYGYGEDNLPVVTADGVRESQNRRVDIILGNQMGNQMGDQQGGQ